jgi:alpha-tubulin suppressor-like RCC1 family protein
VQLVVSGLGDSSVTAKTSTLRESAFVLAPYPLAGLGEQAVVRVACGISHFVLLLANGEVYTVGDNSHGALGAGVSLEASSKAVLVALPAAASTISAANTSRFMGDFFVSFVSNPMLYQHASVELQCVNYGPALK